jgi:hypothetical protein
MGGLMAGSEGWESWIYGYGWAETPGGGLPAGPYTIGDLFVATAADTVSTLPAGAANTVLHGAGLGVAPVYGAVALTTDVSGILPEANGGTGPTVGGTYTTGDLLYASAANTLSKRAIGATGDLLSVAGGVGVWQSPADANQVYVSKDTGAVQDGSLAHPYQTVQAAITAAVAPAEVVIRPGVYSESITAKDGVPLVASGGPGSVTIGVASGGGGAAVTLTSGAGTFVYQGITFQCAVGGQLAAIVGGTSSFYDCTAIGAGADVNAIDLNAATFSWLRGELRQTTDAFEVVHGSAGASAILLDRCKVTGKVYGQSNGTTITGAYVRSGDCQIVLAGTATLTLDQCRLSNSAGSLIQGSGSGDILLVGGSYSTGTGFRAVYLTAGNSYVLAEGVTFKGSSYDVQLAANCDLTARNCTFASARGITATTGCEVLVYDSVFSGTLYGVSFAGVPNVVSRLDGCSFSCVTDISVANGVAAVLASLSGNTIAGGGIVLTGTGTLTWGSNAPGDVFMVTGTIANAALKTLNATPVSVVPAQGANRYIDVISATWMHDYATAAFDGVAAGESLGLRYVGSTQSLVTELDGVGFADVASDQHRHVNAVGGYTPVATVAVEARLAVGEWWAAAGGGALKYRIRYTVRTMDT